ncbi:MAG TPA: LysR family transcriptional regulator [Bauldia sp.]|nr:LysR family transcriptional regulator [Bauldia sp.]
MADLDDLRTFLAAARRGSFAAAARQLNLSPAMVGRRIQNLEERYAVKLIERTTRRQRLTAAGEEFVRRAQSVIEAADSLSEVSSGDALSGRIRMSGPTTLGIKRLPAIITRFVAEHPGVKFEMSLSDRFVDLVSEGFDLAVRVGNLRASTMVARRVGTYRFACCASPDYLARHGRPKQPGDLAAARCILNINLVPRNRWNFYDHAGRALTVEVDGGIEIDNGEAQRALALDGAGIVYLPLDLVESDLAEGRLVRLFHGWKLQTLPVHIVHPSRSLVPRRLTAFIEAVADGFHRSGRP